MRYLYLVITTALFGTLIGCDSSDSSDSLDGLNTSTPVMVNAASGTARSLNGTWSTSCYGDGVSNDTKSVNVIDGSSSKSYDYEYDSTDGSCSGQLVSNVQTDADTGIRAIGGYTTSGWVNLYCSNVGAPLNGAGTAYLSSTPAMTLVTADSWSTPSPMFIDDTGAEWLMYTALSYCGDADADGNPDFALDYVVMQKAS